jgi:hypothetical protein
MNDTDPAARAGNDDVFHSHTPRNSTFSSFSWPLIFIEQNPY